MALKEVYAKIQSFLPDRTSVLVESCQGLLNNLVRYTDTLCFVVAMVAVVVAMVAVVVECVCGSDDNGAASNLGYSAFNPVNDKGLLQG